MASAISRKHFAGISPPPNRALMTTLEITQRCSQVFSRTGPGPFRGVTDMKTLTNPNIMDNPVSNPYIQICQRWRSGCYSFVLLFSLCEDLSYTPCMLYEASIKCFSIDSKHVSLRPHLTMNTDIHHKEDTESGMTDEDATSSATTSNHTTLSFHPLTTRGSKLAY